MALVKIGKAAEMLGVTLQTLLAWAKGWRHEVISDPGSGLNHKKKGLHRLLELISACGA